MNTKRLDEGQSDYLAMLSPPTFEMLSSPQYVNDDVVANPEAEVDGYLSMKPNMIFSPRVTEGKFIELKVSNPITLSLFQKIFSTSTQTIARI